MMDFISYFKPYILSTLSTQTKYTTHTINNTINNLSVSEQCRESASVEYDGEMPAGTKLETLFRYSY